jgi:hypothetical protein
MKPLYLLLFVIFYSHFEKVSAVPTEIKPSETILNDDFISWEPLLAAEKMDGLIVINDQFAGPLNVKTSNKVVQYSVVPDLSPTIKPETYHLHDSLDLIIPRQSFQNKQGQLKVSRFIPGEFPSGIHGQTARISAYCVELSQIQLDSNLQLNWLGNSQVDPKDWYFFSPNGVQIHAPDSLSNNNHLELNHFLAPKINPICFAPMSLGFEHKRIKLNITPNPFSPIISKETQISFKPGMSNDQAVNISLKVYDRFGEIKTLLKADQANQTSQSITWDGTDNKGRPLNNGRYLLVLKVNSVNSNEKYQESKPIYLFK